MNILVKMAQEVRWVLTYLEIVSIQLTFYQNEEISIAHVAT